MQEEQEIKFKLFLELGLDVVELHLTGQGGFQVRFSFLMKILKQSEKKLSTVLS